MLLTASAFQYEMLFVNLKDVSISLQIVFFLYLATRCELECKRRWRGRRKDNMCEEAKDNVNHTNNLKQFSGHKFVWDQLWGLVTQSWIVGGLEKRSISAFFGCNLHTLNFFWFLFFWQHNYSLQLACELDLLTQLDSRSHIRVIVKWNVITCQ